MKRYYIHKDGKVFLVKKGDKFTLPSKEEVPFDIEIKSRINCSQEVYFCNPKIDYFPKDWMHNDELILKDNVDKLAKEAFIYSICKPSVGGIILNEKNEVLMVYGNRGLSKDFWNGPGGFMEFGEAPEEAVLREVYEETGYKTSIDRLLGIYSMVFREACPGYYMITIVYILKVKEKTKDIDKTEISEIRFMPIKEAIEKTKNDFVKMALKDLLKEI